MPIQDLMVFLAEFPKKSAGFRLIGINPTNHRLYMKFAAPEFRSWDIVLAEGALDSAVAGANAQIAVAARFLRAEVEHADGKTTLQILWDVQTFFDSMKVPEVLCDAEQNSAPKLPTSIAAQVFRAPRALARGGNFSQPRRTHATSVIAGCTSSTTFARVYIKEAARAGNEEKESTGAKSQIYQHVDDLSQLVWAQDPRAALQCAAETGGKIAASLRRRGLTISKKSVVIAQNQAMAIKVELALKKAGCPVKAAKFAEDVGVGTAGPGKRAGKTQAKRSSKAKTRARGNARLTKACRQATKLYLTGVAPMNQYAEEIAGASPTQREKAKAYAAKCAGAGAGAQPCTTALVHIRLGEKADPDITTPLRQLKLWMALLEGWPKAEEAKLTPIWRVAARRCSREGPKA